MLVPFFIYLLLMKNLTIVIPSKNEGETLLKCLQLLQLQSIKFDIIIADSSDVKDNNLHQYVNDKNNIKIIDGGLPSVARNMGFELVKTPYVLFLDADMMIYDSELLEICMKWIDKFDLVSCMYRCDDNKYNWLWKVFHILQKLLPETFVIGGFQLWKSEKFLEYGKFNENVMVAEDWLLSRNIIKDKHKLVNKFVYTSGRRFDKKGVLWMYVLMIRSWINRNNKNWFYKSHNYWS